jgi:hypothetical protein
VIFRWQNVALLGAWLRWIHVLNVTRKIRKILIRWQRKFIIASFTIWAEVAECQQRCNATCRRVIQREISKRGKSERRNDEGS